MTIDEAISIMNVIVHMLEPQYDTDRIEEAVEMAINALKQQVTDAVDRVTIKEYLESFEVPQQKMGHWISLDTGKPSYLKDGMTTEGVKCSECGEWLIASDEYACYGRYCPNCGSCNGGDAE